MSEEKERLVAEIPAELKELVDTDRRDNREVVQAALWREFGGERLSALDRRIEEKERRVSMIKSEKNERERELQQEQQELEALQKKREERVNREEEALKEAMDILESVPWQKDNPAIQNHAEELDMTPEDLINQLEDYHA